MKIWPQTCSDALHEECGIFAIYGHKEAAALTALGLHALQHRGQEATGIVTLDHRRFHQYRNQGRVADNFSDENVIAKLIGTAAIGHNRYATTGESSLRNVQPLFAEFSNDTAADGTPQGAAIAHNGNLTNFAELHRQLQNNGALFHSTSDTEIILHLMALSRAQGMVARLSDALHQIEGAWSLVMLSEQGLIGVRDPHGIRPLILGRLEDAWILASESCALDIVGGKFVREIEAGEMVVINQDGVTAQRVLPSESPRFCIFEKVYFARPDSMMGQGAHRDSAYQSRKRIGHELAREAWIDADCVIPVPDSGVPAALGYAEQSGIKFELGIIRNHYVGRTFIEPTDGIRHLGVRLKHNANPDVIQGKRVILVDDSIVRGTTMTKIVEMVRNAGAKSVHLRIASPAILHPCFYGVDTPNKNGLLAARYDLNLAEMAKFLTCDSLAYISITGLHQAVGEARDASGHIMPNGGYCDACFTGKYPHLEQRGRGHSERVPRPDATPVVLAGQQ
ncbi:MAG: amidophosphoribosyltransferase [Candidatus Symbiobacter sp.]|nr:amidophosphoribosyltransferase [Candidatus Symbiobacter sp.]